MQYVGSIVIRFIGDPDVMAEEIDGRDAEDTLGAFDDEAVVF